MREDISCRESYPLRYEVDPLVDSLQNQRQGSVDVTHSLQQEDDGVCNPILLAQLEGLFEAIAAHTRKVRVTRYMKKREGEGLTFQWSGGTCKP